LLAAPLWAAPPLTAPQLVPLPAQMTLGEGNFEINAATALVAQSPDAKKEAQFFAASIAPALGFTLPITTSASKPHAINFVLDSNAKTGAEGYRLNVTPQQITLLASTGAGLFYGGQTLRQLLPVEVFASSRQANVEWQVPVVSIQDAPRFAWRGLMMDCARHFFPVDDVKKFIDTMAVQKLNTLQWHLSDDQGWRLEIKKYPRLTSVGSVRSESPLNSNMAQGDGKPYGGFYTQAQAREIVAYAAARHVNVVPEIEMPGHATAAIAAYPQLGNTDVPGYDPKVATTWGAHLYTFAPKPETFAFLEDVLSETMAIFPSPVIHIGGDEAHRPQWNQSAAAQNFMAQNGLKNVDELQSAFITRIGRFLNAHGRTMAGWDEILQGGLPPGALVMSWRGPAGAVAAATQNHPTVMASNAALYFDRLPRIEDNPNARYVPIARVYDFDPEAPIPPAKRSWLLGMQAQLWAEQIPDLPRLEYMTYPRACALAETAWSPAAAKNYWDFALRLQTHVKRLKELKVNFSPLDDLVLPIGHWQSGQTSPAWKEMEWDVTPQVTANGAWGARFDYTSGSHRLDIAWAELLQDGTAVARDEHEGMSGGSYKNNAYLLDLPTFVPGAHYTLRARVRSDGGSNSNGDVFFARPAATGAVTTSAPPKPQNPHGIWEKDIRAFELADQKNPPAKGGVLFIGSSVIGRWDTLQQDFPGDNVINRGFGGSQIGDSAYFADRIAIPYQPRLIIFYAGSNDIVANRSPEQLLLDYQSFVQQIHAALPQTKIAYVSVVGSPARWSKIDVIKKANALIENYSEQNSYLQFINVFPLMMDATGTPRPELFIEDHLHQTPAGYAVWRQAIAPVLAQNQ